MLYDAAFDIARFDQSYFNSAWKYGSLSLADTLANYMQKLILEPASLSDIVARYSYSNVFQEIIEPMVHQTMIRILTHKSDIEQKQSNLN